MTEIVKLEARIISEKPTKARLYLRRALHSLEWAGRYREAGDLGEARRCLEDAKAAVYHAEFLGAK